MTDATPTNEAKDDLLHNFGDLNPIPVGARALCGAVSTNDLPGKIEAATGGVLPDLRGADGGRVVNPNPAKHPEIFFVFDVESIGLHGEAYAVGWCAVNTKGEELQSAMYAIDPKEATGSPEDRKWVEENIPPLTPTCDAATMIEWFWSDWLGWKAKGAAMAADCAWPVEARFLCKCVDSDKSNRVWEGPYPLIDIGTVLLARCYDPLKEMERLPNELPKHNPLCDARQSARILTSIL